uniref:Superoxide dismutase [Cu-Zn] n=1 Tax=Liposcelis entomophila TaxID=550478 RepID=A0A7D7PEY2_9NEOP|nr:extracellular CuZn superoxide dismutase [Liposcelis entomophila]
MNFIWVCLFAVVGVTYGARRVTRQYAIYPGGPYSPQLSPYQASPYQISPYQAINPYAQVPVPGFCKLKSASGTQVTGEIYLQQRGPLAPVEISGTVFGLTPGLHGFHVHQNGSVDDNCAAAGPHFNPNNNTHGAPVDMIRHAGDLGNIIADAHGIAPLRIFDPYVSLLPGNPLLILGKAIVVHEKEDDLGKGPDDESKKTGNAGKRLACCVIEPIKYNYF